MTQETSQTICKWGDATFGKADSIKAYAERAREELNELLDAIENAEPSDNIIAEAADVTILLHRLTGTIGADLYEAVDKKMSINRKRQWVKNDNGTGQHK